MASATSTASTATKRFKSNYIPHPAKKSRHTNNMLKSNKSSNTNSYNSYNKNKIQILPIILTILILQIFHSIPTTNATVTLLGTDGKYYATIQERRFGKLLSYGVTYLARMQYFGSTHTNDSYGGYHHQKDEHNIMNHYPMIDDKNDEIDDMDHTDATLCNKNITKISEKLIVPPDGLPGKI